MRIMSTYKFLATSERRKSLKERGCYFCDNLVGVYCSSAVVDTVGINYDPATPFLLRCQILKPTTARGGNPRLFAKSTQAMDCDNAMRNRMV